MCPAVSVMEGDHPPFGSSAGNPHLDGPHWSEVPATEHLDASFSATGSWLGLDESFASSMDVDSSFDNINDSHHHHLHHPNGYFYNPNAVSRSGTPVDPSVQQPQQPQMDGDFDDDVDGDEEEEDDYDPDADYDAVQDVMQQFHDETGDADEDAMDDGSATPNRRSTASPSPQRSSRSPARRASPTRDGRSIPSVSLLYAPKRDARAILGRQYFETPIAKFSEAHSDVFIVTKKEKSRGDEFKTFAVKRQHLADPDNLADKAYRELRILMQLRRLEENNMCQNFVYLRDWIKSVPPLMFPVSGKIGPDDQFIYFELEYAPKSLRSIKAATLKDFKSILFQCIYALYVAQKEYKFVHNDLHAKNVLLQDPNPERPFLAYQDFDKIWYASGYMVKITDFGLSRLQLETREVVHNPKNSFGEMFSQSRDLEKLTQELPKISDWADVPNSDSQRLWLRNLLSKMRNGNPSPRDLLREPFFDELMQRPPNMDSSNTVLSASHGNVANLRRIVDGEHIDLPPAGDPFWLTQHKDLLAEQYAALAQLQERYRALRKQQPNLYIQYVSKSFSKPPRKKKVKRAPVVRAPRPPKPIPVAPPVVAPAPAPLVPEGPPPPPPEPLTREERREQNDTVRWFRELGKLANEIAAISAALPPRRARAKQADQKPAPVPAAPRPVPIPRPREELPAPPRSPIQAAAPSSPVKPHVHTSPKRPSLTQPPQILLDRTTSGHVDEEAEVDILGEEEEKKNTSPPPPVMTHVASKDIEPAVDHMEDDHIEIEEDEKQAPPPTNIAVKTDSEPVVHHLPIEPAPQIARQEAPALLEDEVKSEIILLEPPTPSFTPQTPASVAHVAPIARIITSPPRPKLIIPGAPLEPKPSPPADVSLPPKNELPVPAVQIPTREQPSGVKEPQRAGKRMPPSMIPSTAPHAHMPRVGYVPTAGKTLLPQSLTPTHSVGVPSTSIPPKKGRGRPPKSSKPPQPVQAAKTLQPVPPPQKKRSLFSIMNEIATTCSSLEHMFSDQSQVLPERRARRSSAGSASKRQRIEFDESEKAGRSIEAPSERPQAQPQQHAVAPAEAPSSTAPSVPTNAEQHGTAINGIEQSAGPVAPMHDPLSFMNPFEPQLQHHGGADFDFNPIKPFFESEPAGLFDSLEHVLEEADGRLLPVDVDSSRGRSLEQSPPMRKRKREDDDDDDGDRPVSRAMAFSEDATQAGGAQSNNGHRSTKRLQVDFMAPDLI